MHGVTSVRARKMGDARARHDQVRRVRMIDGRPYLAGALDRVVVEPQIDLRNPRKVIESHATPNGIPSELTDPVASRKHIERGLVVADAGDTAPTGVVLQLQES